MKNPKRTTSDRKKFIAVVAGATLLIGGTFGINAFAESKVGQHVQLAASDTVKNGFFHKAGWGKRHHRGNRFANMTDEEIEKKINRMVRHVAIEIDATDDQTKKITQLVTAVAKDMKPVHESMRTAGKQVHELLLKDAIDRNALEQLRSERIAEMDRVSKNLTNALADVAEVLTAKQRTILDERIKDFRKHRRHGFWRRG